MIITLILKYSIMKIVERTYAFNSIVFNVSMWTQHYWQFQKNDTSANENIIITKRFFIWSFFCCKNASGMPVTLSWAETRRSHNSPIKDRAFLPFRKPVRLICILRGSGNWKIYVKPNYPSIHDQCQRLHSYKRMI